MCVFAPVITDERGGGTGLRKEFFLNDMYGSDSHLFGGSFQTVETMLLHFATIAPV